MKNKHKKIITVLLPVAIIPVLYGLAYIYRNYIGIYVLPCPFYTFLHIYCPGCGGTRFVYALLDGDFLRAVRCNAVFAGAAVLAALYWAENLIFIMGKEIKIIPRSSGFKIAVSGIAAAYLILRNFMPIIAP
jgi:hypothetical protein